MLVKKVHVFPDMEEVRPYVTDYAISFPDWQTDGFILKVRSIL